MFGKPRPTQVRSTAVSYLQRSVVAAEKLAIPAEQVQQSLLLLVLPMAHDLSKLVHAGGVINKDKFQQVGGLEGGA